MKKILLLVMALFLVASPVMAPAAFAGNSIINLANVIGADMASAAYVCTGSRCVGKYLYTYDIKTSADDAVTLTIYSRNGTSLEAITTTAATSGEAGTFTSYWMLTGKETYQITGIGSGTATVDITVVE